MNSSIQTNEAKPVNKTRTEVFIKRANLSRLKEQYQQF